MSDPPYDVVIVGAGFAGALIADQLVREDQNRRILILEAGTDQGLPGPDKTPFAAWQEYQDYHATFETALIKVPNSAYPNNPFAPQPSVLDITKILPGVPDRNGYFVQVGPRPFSSDYTRAAGGTSLHWLGICLRMLPNDFKMQSTYGRGVDWPLEYKDLKRDYEQAELTIGVSADVDALKYPGITGKRARKKYFGDYQYPMRGIPQSYVDRWFSEALDGLSVEVEGDDVPVDVVPIPQGRNGMPNPDYIDPRTGKPYTPIGAVGSPHTGERCAGNSSCIPICPIQAKYNALKTLQHAQLMGVEIRSRCVATGLDIDADSGRISGVRYTRYAAPGSAEGVVNETVTGHFIVLAANAIENAKLLLAAGAAGTSGQVGRNLMDHPYLLTWALLPESVGPFRGPFATSGIPSFRDGPFRANNASFRTDLGNWGWNFPTGAPFTDVDNMVDRGNLFGPTLRRALHARISRQVRFGFLIEQLPASTNRVTIDPAYTDALGAYRPVISYDVSEYERAGMALATKVWNSVVRRLGAEDFTQYSPADPGYVPFDGQGFTYHGSGHVVGTHRMAADRHAGVVDTHQRAWDHPNLYVAGAGSMPTIGTSNPTLTLAALTFRTARHLGKALRKGRG